MKTIFIYIFCFATIILILSCQVEEKRLLPTEIEIGTSEFHYTYDEQNRFTSVKILLNNKLYNYNSLVYKDNKVTIYDIDGNLRASVEIDKKDKYNYSYKYFIGDETYLMNIRFNPQYKISRLEYKHEEHDDYSERYEFKYDKNSNIIDIIIPDDIRTSEINRAFKTFVYCKVYYDNKNGIFKCIDPITSPIIILQENTFPYLSYMGGNQIDEIVKSSDIESDLINRGIYNEHNYPTQLGLIEVKKYIEAK